MVLYCVTQTLDIANFYGTEQVIRVAMLMKWRQVERGDR